MGRFLFLRLLFLVRLLGILLLIAQEGYAGTSLIAASPSKTVTTQMKLTLHPNLFHTPGEYVVKFPAATPLDIVIIPELSTLHHLTLAVTFQVLFPEASSAMLP